MRIISWIVVAVVVVGAGYFAIQKYSNKDLNSGKEVRVTDNKSEESIVGNWQSSDDKNSIVIFKKNGTTEDIYDGKTLSSGTWKITNGTKLTDGSISEGTFLETIIDGEKYNYKVISVDSLKLNLTYLPRGNTLSYERVINN